MGKPAARVGDWHECPEVDPVTKAPHTGGEIKGPGCESVLIGGKPAAVFGDACACIGQPDMISRGSTGVFIGGKPAAREDDLCVHGGKVTSGLASVLIGERRGEARIVNRREWTEPYTEERIKLINKAIKTAIKLLTDKHLLLENNDANTLKKFKKWFGVVGEDEKYIIIDRVKKSLIACKMLTCTSFISIYNEDDRAKEIARIYKEDYPPVIFIGDLFWKCKEKGKPSRASTVIHELSHLKYIGNTEDVIYGKKRCKELAKNHPKLALKNADSFELFILS